jgi:CDP-paratose 2-epimerase
LKTAIVTGSCGLVGSEAVEFLGALGWRIVGVDNNMRARFFGVNGDTTKNLEHLLALSPRYEHRVLDIRDRAEISRLIQETRPDLVFHCAAQPSHDLAASRPFEDFEINATGTLNLLESMRRHRPETPFVFMSTNKVYGDAPNELELVELETRYDYADPADRDGVDETMRIDTSLHSLFGASKAAADLLVQEYGRYFGMPTCCLRAGCVTGPRHLGTELHGFLAYLARCIRDRVPYQVYGYQGKQVRDNIHSFDVCAAMMAFVRDPRCAAVYNIGGGRSNSISLLEAIAALEDIFGRNLEWSYVDEPRRGDHLCYISNCSRLSSDYPSWEITIDLKEILAQLGELCAPRVIASRSTVIPS